MKIYALGLDINKYRAE